MEALASIFSYTHARYWGTTLASRALSTLLPPLARGARRKGMTPWAPRHTGEGLVHRLDAPGQDDVQESPQLRHRQRGRFFPPRAAAGARESKAPASSSA